MCQYILADAITRGRPQRHLALMAVMLGKLAGAVERDPAHRPRIDERLRLATHLPDTLVNLLPVMRNKAGNLFGKSAQIALGLVLHPFLCALVEVVAHMLDGKRVLGVMRFRKTCLADIVQGGFGDLAVDIKLALCRRAIADSHGA